MTPKKAKKPLELTKEMEKDALKAWIWECEQCCHVCEESSYENSHQDIFLVGYRTGYEAALKKAKVLS